MNRQAAAVGAAALVACLLMSWPGTAAAGPDLASSFPGLAARSVVRDWITVRFEPRLTSPPRVPDTGTQEIEGSGVLIQYPFDIRLSAASARLYQFVCSSGGSADSECILWESGGSAQPRVALHVAGTAFAVPGDGCLYSAGHTNGWYDTRRKFCETGDRVEEVRQPFRHVGLRSEALRDLAVFADRGLTRFAGTIRKGAFVEVVLDDRGVYLVRDGFGITGWLRLPTTPPDDPQQASDIRGFFFAGD